jgi:hypothetical protein
MVIDNEKLASILEKCADYIEAAELEKTARQEQRQSIVKQASDMQVQRNQQKTESAKEVLSSLLDKEISDTEAQKFAQSDLGIELLNKISTTPSEELGVVTGTDRRAPQGKRAHWNSFASQLLETM